MGKVEIKTKATDNSIVEHIAKIEDDQKRMDAETLLKIFKKATGEKPKLWSNSSIGFGEVVYKSPKTGREVDWFKIGFAARKNNFSLHLTMDVSQFESNLKKLGKHKTGKGCLYINKLSDVDIKVLEDLINQAAKG